MGFGTAQSGHKNIDAPDFCAETLRVAAQILLSETTKEGPERRNSINSGIYIPLLPDVIHPMYVIIIS